MIVNQTPVVKIAVSENGKKIILTFEYNKSLIDIIKNIPNFKYSNKQWEFSLSNEAKIIHVIHTLISRFVTVSLTPESNKRYKQALKKHETKKDKINEIIKLKEMEDYPLDVSKFVNVDLFPFQRVSYKFIEETGCNCILSLSMGLGKTLVSISYVTSKKYKALVICPSSLKLNWADEIDKFTFGATYQVLNSGNEVSWRDVKDFTIINYDLLVPRKSDNSKKTLESLIQCITKDKFDLVILDESQRIKNDSTTWTKFIHKNLQCVDKKLLLSATPIKSRPIEYFSQLKFIDKKRWNSKTEFGFRYCAPENNGFGITYNGASHLEELYFETAPYIIRKEKQDVLKDLPDKLYTKIPIQLSSAELKKYIELEGVIIEEILESEKEHGEDNSKVRIGSVGKLQQIKQFTTSIKVSPAKEIINSVLESEQKIIVFSGYNDPLHELHNLYKNSVLFVGSMNEKQKHEAYRTFVEDKDCKIFFGGIISAGVGLNLQIANNVLFLDQPWTPADYEQAIDRAYRIGTINNVSVMTLVCQKTIDEYVYSLIEEKKKVVSKIMDNKEYKANISVDIVKDVLNIYRKKYKNAK